MPHMRTVCLAARRLAPFALAFSPCAVGQVVDGVAPVDAVPAVPVIAPISLEQPLWQLVLTKLTLDATGVPEAGGLDADAVLVSSASTLFGVVLEAGDLQDPTDEGLRPAHPRGQAVFRPQIDAAGTNPSGDMLVWSGRVVAIEPEPGETGSNPVIGRVTVAIRGGPEARADVSFTDLVELGTGQKRDPVTWQDVPLSGGTLGTEGEGLGIRGLFLGEDHAEVGGTFRQEGFAGAFSAVRGDLPPGLHGPAPPVFEGPVSSLMRQLMSGPDLGLTTAAIAPADGRSDGLDSPVASGDPVEPSPFFEDHVIDVLGMSSSPLDYSGRFRTALTIGLESPDQVAISPLASTAGHGAGTQYARTGTAFAGVTFQIPGFLPEPLDTSPPEIRNGTIASWGFSTISSPPRGTARWEGSMMATDTSMSATRGNHVTGKALVTVGLNPDPAIDVEFADVKDVDAGLVRDGIKWSGLPLGEGVFAVAGDGYLRGAFFGPRFEGVSGIFERDSLSGTFNASRTSDACPDAPHACDNRGVDAAGYAVHAIATFSARVRLQDGQRGIEAVAAVEDLVSASRGQGAPAGTVQKGEFPGVRFGRLSADIESLAGWLENGYFAAALVYPGAQADEPRGDPIASVAMFTGMASQSTPADVSATWTGHMLATEGFAGLGRVGLFRGSARVTLRMGSHVEANVRFSGVADLSGAHARPDMTWLGIPVINGYFHSTSGPEWLRGHFLGTDHQEVGGSFDWRGLRGVFGAVSQVP